MQLHRPVTQRAFQDKFNANGRYSDYFFAIKATASGEEFCGDFNGVRGIEVKRKRVLVNGLYANPHSEPVVVVH